MTLNVSALMLMVVLLNVHEGALSDDVNIGSTLHSRPMNDVDSYTIVLPGKTLNISCPGFITTVDIYSVAAQTLFHVYVLRKIVNSRENVTTQYAVVAQTELKTKSVGIERHGLDDFINVRAGDAIGLGYFENNPIPYTGLSGECARDNRCSWYHTNSTAQLVRESKNNSILSLTEADIAAVFPCRVYSIRLTLRVDGCATPENNGAQRVVEFLGIAVAVAFVIVLIAVNIHNLAGPSSRIQVDTPMSLPADSDEGGVAVDASPDDSLDSWPLRQWKGEIMTPPPYEEVDPAPPAPSPPPYHVFTLSRVDV